MSRGRIWIFAHVKSILFDVFLYCFIVDIADLEIDIGDFAILKKIDMSKYLSDCKKRRLKP